MDWYYAQDGDKKGPISGIELKQLADDGSIRPDDLVWREGLTDWILARKVRGLIDTPSESGKSPDGSSNAGSDAASTERSGTSAAESASATGSESDATPDDGSDNALVDEIRIETRRRKKKKSDKKTPEKKAGGKLFGRKSAAKDSASAPADDVATAAKPGAAKPGVAKPGVAKLDVKSDAGVMVGPPKSGVTSASGPKLISMIDSGVITPPPQADVSGPAALEPPAKPSKHEKRRKKKLGELDADLSGLAASHASGSALAVQSPDSGSHPLDKMIHTVRAMLGPQFVNTASGMFRTAGYWGIYAAMGAIFFYCIMLGIKTGAILPMVALALACIPGLFVAQYVAVRFCRALEHLIGSMPGRISSTALLDCLAMMVMVTAGCLLLAVGVVAVFSGQYYMLLVALAVFILGEFLAIVCIFPESVQVEMDEQISGAEAAIGLLTFAVKLSCRMAIAVFGVGVVIGACGIAMAVIPLVIGDTSGSDASGDESTYSEELGDGQGYEGVVQPDPDLMGMPGGPGMSVMDLVMGGAGGGQSQAGPKKPSGPIPASVTQAMGFGWMLSYSTMIPMVSYVSVLMAFLILDLLRGVLQLHRIDEKLTRLCAETADDGSGVNTDSLKKDAGGNDGDGMQTV